MRSRQRLYRRAKSTRSPSLLASYRSLRNLILSSLKHSKASFFRSLSHSPSSKFWSFVKSLRKSTSCIRACHQMAPPSSRILTNPSASILFSLLVLTPLLLLFPPFLLPLLLCPALPSSFALRTAFAILFPNFHPKLLLVQMASHHGCLKPHLHLSPLLFATYLTFPFPLAWYPWTGNPPLSSQFQNHPLLQILLLTIGLSLSFVSSVNFLKSIFTPFSLIFVCLAISSHPSSLVSSLNAQLPLLCSFLLTPFFLSLNLMFLSVVSFLY